MEGLPATGLPKTRTNQTRSPKGEDENTTLYCQFDERGRPTPTYEKGEPTRKWKAYQRPDCRKYDQTRPETRSPKGEDEKTTLFRWLTKKKNPPVKWKAYQRPNCRKHEDEKDEQTRPDRRMSRTKIRPYIVNWTRKKGPQVARLPKI
jgi:hypothetical protein